MINATKEVPNCTFFVAPYLQTPQLAQFYADSLIQVAFGTSRLLVHNEFDQAIVDFSLENENFTFIDRSDLKLGKNDTVQNIARFFILAGTVYSMDELKGERQFADLKSELERSCDQATTPADLKTLLKPSSDDKKTFLY